MRALPLCTGGADLAPQLGAVRRWEGNLWWTAGSVVDKDLSEGVQEKHWRIAGLQGGLAQRVPPVDLQQGPTPIARMYASITQRQAISLLKLHAHHLESKRFSYFPRLASGQSWRLLY